MNSITVEFSWHKAETLPRQSISSAQLWAQIRCMQMGWYHLGLAYSQSHKTDEAMASFEEALRVYPDYLAARYMLADCCHKRGDLQGELNLLAELVRSAPEFAEARYNFGLSLKNDGKVQRAAEELRAAVRLSSRNPRYLLALGIALAEVDKNEAVNTLRNAVKSGPQNADGHYNLGLALAEVGEDTAAAAEFRRAIELNPKHASALRALGVALMHGNRLEESADVLRRAIEVAPKDAEAGNNLGTVLLRLKDTGGAIEVLEQALRSNPNLIKAHANLTQAYQRAGRGSDALRETERVRELTADQRNRGRAMVLVQSGKEQFAAGRTVEAVSSLREAIAASSGFPDAHFELGRAIRDSGGSPDDAIASFRRVLNLDPERAEAHYQIGVTLENSVRQAEAIREYETAVEMAPCQVDARTALGRAALKLGQWATAAAQFRAVIALQPKNAEAKKSYDQASESAASERKP